MFAMSYGYLPFESDLSLERHGSDPVAWSPNNVFALYQYISSTPIKLPASPEGGLSSLGQDLLRGLLTADPTRRLTIEQIWRHPWISLAP